MPEAKTQITAADVDAFVDAVPDSVRREDARTLLTMMRAISGERGAMWGSAMIGFGRYRYRFGSGREGEAFLMGFSPRKAEQVLYVLTGDAREQALLAALGKHRQGKGCLYIKTLAGVDTEVLDALLRECWATMQARHSA